MNPLKRLFRALVDTYVTDVRDLADGEAKAYLDKTPIETADKRLVIVILTVMFCLITMRFYGSTNRLGNPIDLLRMLGLDGQAAAFDQWVNQDVNARFHQRLFWAAARVLLYLVIPIGVVKLVLKDSLIEYGGRFKGILPSAKTYGVMFAIIFPIVIIASFSQGFQNKYPFYRVQQGEALWPYFFLWELLYALQFVGLEFFYRGFLLHGIRHRVGYPSIFVMMVPYMMIHFGKPLPECIGSIIAGFVLGTLSIKSRSIWWGAVIHIAVAWLMDGLSLWHQGLLF